MKIKTLLFHIFIIFSICQTSQLYAEQSVDDVQLPETSRRATSDELPLDRRFHPVQGTSYYDVFLANIKIGKATIEVTANGDQYQVKVAAKTRSLFNQIYKFKYKGEVEMQPDPLQPANAAIVEETGKRVKTYDMQFPTPDKVIVVQEDFGGSKPPTRKQKSFESESFILDPFSVVYLIRSLEWKKDTAEVFDVFTGKKQYELQLYCSGETTLTIDGEARQAWMIHPRTRTLDEKRKLSLARWTVYLSTDNRRQILQIKGHPKIGRITAQMRKFEHAPKG